MGNPKIDNTEVVHGDPQELPKKVLEFVSEIAQLCQPDKIWLCDGSEDENKDFTRLMLEENLVVNLPKYENCVLARTNPQDVARMESKTYICTEVKREAIPEPKPGVKGTLGNWMSLKQLDEEIKYRFPGCMKGRTLYILPFSMGPIGSPISHIGVQASDSVYVAASMRIMTRMGKNVYKVLGDKDFVKCIHSVGVPLPAQKPIINNWPCDPEKTMVAHKTKTNEIWSYGSGYGGNSLLGKKCFSLRIGSAIARREGWLAEHMLIVGITNPQGVKKYIVGAFPSQCGKTNLAMLTSPIPGYKIECVGDDIAWMRFDENGVLRAINPEFGFFGVCPGTNHHTNPVAMDMIFKNTIFTNVAKTSDGGVFWEGLENDLKAHVSITAWTGEKNWTRDSGKPAAHPNARFCTPLVNCPILDPHWNSPEGVPISAILFGGRRPEGIPLIYETRSWKHGVYAGASVSSEATSAAEYKGHKVMHDPFSARPFLSYNAGKYIEQWLQMEKDNRKMPKIFHVNWFRKNKEGHYLWPGFGENIRVLDWIMRRCDNEPIAVESPIGLLPKEGSINLEGLPDPINWEELFELPEDFWRREMNDIETYFNQQIGEDLPPAIREEIENQKKRLGISK
ncbi:phosphoenolpyruvate carboxykinase [GTP]-like [Artemia franciscana]